MRSSWTAKSSVTEDLSRELTAANLASEVNILPSAASKSLLHRSLHEGCDYPARRYCIAGMF
jgi:hypothetical protein